ncbi:DNase1 protein [Rutstroemia sp. NJR-2017a BBW]|nr:DNase1 protein [Rutstroemia sp. NJR-2017a BBW]
MRFSNTLLTLALSLPLAYADNLITFIPQDDQARIIYFTSNPGYAIIPDLYAPAGKTVSVTLPHGWQGNFKAPHAGADKNANWILGEVAFQGGDDHKLISYDVSAIVNQTDGTGIHWLYPTSGNGFKSGCDTFPCNTAYVGSDDVQTRTTYETTLTCLLG